MIDKKLRHIIIIIRLAVLSITAMCGFEITANSRDFSSNDCLEDTLCVPVVCIKNTEIETFIKERIIKTAEYAFRSRDSVIAYQMTIQPNENGTYTIGVSAIGYDVPEPVLIGFDNSIENGDLYNAYVTYIAGHLFLISAKPDSPYIEECNKQMKYIKKGTYTMWNDFITWYLSISDENLTSVCLDFEISPDITLDGCLRRDFYLLPNACVEVPAFQCAPASLLLDSICPPAFVRSLNLCNNRNWCKKENRNKKWR